ncbi:MAG: N-acetylmuramoyl-L-alanine amidase [Lachnospiraceae bacterium]|nr:N-acetylmuramoyl-L-alanine amidase [Lachnospiraceae bacterium]
MEINTEFRKKLTRIASLTTLIASIALFSAMYAYAENKTVIINDATEEAAEEEKNESYRFTVPIKSDKNAVYLSVPHPEITDDKISVVCKYGEKHLLIGFKTDRDNFFYNKKPHGNFTGITECTGDYNGKELTYDFTLSDFQYPEIYYADEELIVRLRPLSDLKAPVIMIDPYYGGKEAGTIAGSAVEKDILSKIAYKLDKMAQNKPYTLLFTRLGDGYVSMEERFDSVNITKPDCYVGLKLSSDVSDVRQFGMYASYNDDYYNEDFDGVDLADLLLRNVCTETKNKARGIVPADSETELISGFSVPSVVLYAGFISNSEEALLLQKDEYIELIARGMIKSFDEIYGDK